MSYLFIERVFAEVTEHTTTGMSDSFCLGAMYLVLEKLCKSVMILCDKLCEVWSQLAQTLRLARERTGNNLVFGNSEMAAKVGSQE